MGLLFRNLEVNTTAASAHSGVSIFPGILGPVEVGCVHSLGIFIPLFLGMCSFLGMYLSLYPWEYSSLYSLGCVRSLGCIYPFIPREYLSLYSSGCIYPFIPRDAFIPLFLGNIFPLFFGNINPFIPWDAFIPVAHGVSAQDHFPGSGTAGGSAPGRAAQSRGSPWAPG